MAVRGLTVGRAVGHGLAVVTLLLGLLGWGGDAAGAALAQTADTPWVTDAPVGSPSFHAAPSSLSGSMPTPPEMVFAYEVPLSSLVDGGTTYVFNAARCPGGTPLTGCYDDYQQTGFSTWLRLERSGSNVRIFAGVSKYGAYSTNARSSYRAYGPSDTVRVVWGYGESDMVGTPSSGIIAELGGTNCATGPAELRVEEYTADGAGALYAMDLTSVSSIGSYSLTTAGDLWEYTGSSAEAITYDELVDFFGDGCEIPADQTVPRLACGRTLENLGGGQFAVEVEGYVRNPVAGASDDEGYWTASWEPGIRYPGRRTTIPLPLESSSDEDLGVMWHMSRTYAETDGGGIAWSETQDLAGEWTTLDAPENVGAWWNPTDLSGWAWLADTILPGGSGADPTVWDFGFGPPGYYVFDDGYHIVVPGVGYHVETVHAACSAPASPAGADTDPGIVIIIVPPDDGAPPDDGTVDGTGPEDPPPGAEDPADSCGGGSWFNPFTVLKSIFCGVFDLAGLLGQVIDALVDLATAVGGLVTSLLEGLADLLVPELAVLSSAMSDAVGQIRTSAEGRVPFTWVSSLWDGATAVSDNLDGGDSCQSLGYAGSGGAVPAGWADGLGSGCSIDLGGAGEYASLSRSLWSLLIWTGLAARMWTLAPWNKGKDSGVPS